MEAANEQRWGSVSDAPVLRQREKPLSQVRESAIEAPLPLQELTSSGQDVAERPTQAQVPTAGPVRRPVSPTTGPAARELRQLRVKVWPQEDLTESTQPEKERKSVESTLPERSTYSETGTATDTALDDLPTRPLMANPSTPPPQRAVTPSQAEESQESAPRDVDQLDTTPLIAPVSSQNQKRPAAAPTPLPVVRAEPVEQRFRQAAERGNSISRSPLHSSQPVTPPSRSAVQPQPALGRIAQHPISPVPPLAPAQEGRQGSAMPLPAKTETPRQTKRSGRTPVLAVLVVLAVLIIGGLAGWIIAFHPFTVPAVTQPQQIFSNTQLGFSVLYPSGWTAQTNPGKGTVLFSDSSHTGQVEIAVTASSVGLSQSLSKEEAQLGLTGIKSETPLLFAGTSWQRVQGSMQVSGANYTAVLLAVMHGSHIYTIIQMAPQVTYADEDHLIFSSMRSSFTFLA